jgi:alkylation response protein AidB-like acyl-CoA dehydrogenase
MDFRLSKMHQLFQRTVAEFVDKEVIPVAQEIDERNEFPRKLFKRIGELGYFGLRYPKDVGGIGSDTIMFMIFCEELARGSMSVAASATMQCLMGTNFVYQYGNDNIKNRIFIPALKGDKVGVIAFTEPDAGSDLSAMKTTATKSGNHWILNGSKTWITNAYVADYFTVAALTDRTRGLRSVNFFLVEKGTPGFTISGKIEKLGLRGTESAELVFENCRIPEENLLGIESKGISALMSILSEIRVMTGALSIGLARASFDAALRYSKERVQFGSPIGKFQAIRIKLANMATELEAARLLVYYAAWLIDQKVRCMKEASMAKLYASELANKVVDETSRIFASYGYAMDFPIQRYLRDAKFLLFGGGTSEILQDIICNELGLKSI